MDRETLEPLIRIHQAEIFRYLRYLGASPGIAEDVLQETFLAAYTQPRHPDPETAPLFAGWLRGIARNRFLMHCRRTRTEKTALDVAAVERAESVWRREFLRDGDGFDYLEALRRCLSRLDERHRRALDLAYRERKSRAELAEALRLSEEGVKSLLRRLRDALGGCVRKQLGAEA